MGGSVECYALKQANAENPAGSQRFDGFPRVKAGSRYRNAKATLSSVLHAGVESRGFARSSARVQMTNLVFEC